VEVVTQQAGQYHTPNDPRPVPNMTVVRRGWEEPASARVRQGNLTMMNNFQFNFHVFGHEELIETVAAPFERPLRARLAGVYPNPFNPVARVDYSLSAAGRAELALYDLLGRRVALLAEGHQPAGEHQAQIEGSGLASGVYLLQLNLDGRPADSRKVLLLK
jgi:hypothetical protein